MRNLHCLLMLSVASVTAAGCNAAGVDATGWLQDGTNWGRPADVMQLADGSLLVSDDMANVIYRISYAAN